MLKLMMIPHMLKNYGLGVMEVTFWQFFIPALITGSLYQPFGLIWEVSLMMFMQYLTLGKFQK